MEIPDILITPDNHHVFNLSEEEYLWTHSIIFNSCFRANNSINEYFEAVLGDGQDWGGEYATWLDRIGIDSNSENGWWSIAAVDRENIEAFIEFEQDETEGGIRSKYHALYEKIKSLPSNMQVSTRTKKVKDLLTPTPIVR